LLAVGRGALETLAMSALGTLLAALLGLALALPAAGRFGWPARALVRLVLNALRAIPELVWAALMVLAAGLGPTPAPWRWPCIPPECSGGCLPKPWRTPPPP